LAEDESAALDKKKKRRVYSAAQQQQHKSDAEDGTGVAEQQPVNHPTV
jgi:hypothetical protein